MKVKIKSEARNCTYTVEKTEKGWRCNCADFSAKTSLQLLLFWLAPT